MIGRRAAGSSPDVVLPPRGLFGSGSLAAAIRSPQRPRPPPSPPPPPGGPPPPRLLSAPLPPPPAVGSRARARGDHVLTEAGGRRRQQRGGRRRRGRRRGAGLGSSPRAVRESPPPPPPGAERRTGRRSGSWRRSRRRRRRQVTGPGVRAPAAGPSPPRRGLPGLGGLRRPGRRAPRGGGVVGEGGWPGPPLGRVHLGLRRRGEGPAPWEGGRARLFTDTGGRPAASLPPDYPSFPAGPRRRAGSCARAALGRKYTGSSPQVGVGL